MELKTESLSCCNYMSSKVWKGRWLADDVPGVTSTIFSTSNIHQQRQTNLQCRVLRQRLVLRSVHVPLFTAVSLVDIVELLFRVVDDDESEATPFAPRFTSHSYRREKHAQLLTGNDLFGEEQSRC